MLPGDTSRLDCSCVLCALPVHYFLVIYFESDKVNNNKLYVGNLSYAVTGPQLEELFSQAGNVTSASVITDKQSGRSKGFGFVEFDSPAGAQKAIEMFHGKEFQGRNLTVNEARPLQPRA